MSAEHVRIANASFWLGYLRAELHPTYGETDIEVVKQAVDMLQEALYGPTGDSADFPRKLPEATS